MDLVYNSGNTNQNIRRESSLSNTPYNDSTLSQNIFPCWLAQYSETPHRITLYLKLNQPAENHQDYHLQMELLRENWQLLQSFFLPWHLHFAPQKLFLVTLN